MNTRILVTGSNRSGSTWVGKVIAQNNSVDNIIEPLNPNRIQRFGKFNLDKWYYKIDGNSNEELKKEINALISYYLNCTPLNLISHPFEKYENHNFITSFKKRFRRANRPIKLLKDPTGLFCIPWLVDNYNVKPVVLIRHPGAYVLSIKQKNWWFDFDHLLDQPSFFTGPLEELHEEVLEYKQNEKKYSIIENASLLWKVFYTQVKYYQTEFPQWFFITHEELSLDSLKSYKNLFSYLNIPFTNSIKSYIIDSTQASKQSEGKHMRDAKKNIQKWKSELDDSEKEIVYKITRSIASHFYNSESWK